VADHDEGAVEAVQPALPASRSRQVEVVGRLVEEQEVGLLRQRRTIAARRRSTAACRAVERRESIPSWSAIAAASCASGAPAPLSTHSQRRMAGHRRILLQQHDLLARHHAALARVGVDRPARHFSSVVLPAPLRPISASRSRGPDMHVEPAEQPALALNEAEIFKGKMGGGMVRCLYPDASLGPVFFVSITNR
jgi:hypothetical protein